MKWFALFILLPVSFTTVAQQINTDLQIDSLIQKLQENLALKKDIEISEIKGVYKLTPWHFAPNLNYDFINNNYYLTISTGPIISNLLGKRQETRRISAIERRYTNLEYTSEIKLKSTYLQVIQKLTNINLSYDILLNDIEIYKIKAQQHEANEIDTETFLRERSSILNKIKSHNTEVADIQRYLLDIEQLTEYEVNLNLLHYFYPPLEEQQTTYPPLEGAGGGHY
ncbi:MAG: hypothetical protein LBI45_06135 [Bacteroidales bacterium]|jgi:hypothetical protein|nr:hypothetical protein [Bacteroidales bacterium]